MCKMLALALYLVHVMANCITYRGELSFSLRTPKRSRKNAFYGLSEALHCSVHKYPLPSFMAQIIALLPLVGPNCGVCSLGPSLGP